MRRFLLALAIGAVVLLPVLPGVAATKPVAAKFGPVTRLGPWAGAEPSVAFDPSGNGVVYVVAPQGGPSGLTGAVDVLVTGIRAADELACSTVFECEPLPPSSGIKPGSKGVGFWASTDHGRTWRLNRNVGSGTGGFDSDVAVGADHTVYVADLEVYGSSICSSSNQGRDFSSVGLPAVDTCEGISFNQQGPDNDREWITVGRKGELYLTYHDLAGGFPIMLVSKDKAKTFTPCGSMLDPQGPAGANYSPLSGTLVAKPVVGKDGSIYVTITEPDNDASPVGGALNHLYIAVASGGCDAQKIWKNYKIYENPGASFTLFNSLAMDGGGVLYAVAAGKTAAGQSSDSLWLFVSRDKGAHWTAPIKVNTPTIRGNVMPAVAGGLRANQVAIGWYGTSTSGDPGNLKNAWRYWVATSFDGGRRFLTSAATGTLHYGAVCTQGVFCDPLQDSGNRNLYDFTSIGVNPRTGCLLVVTPGDPWNRPDIDSARNDFLSAAYVTSQTSGTCLR